VAAPPRGRAARAPAAPPAPAAPLAISVRYPVDGARVKDEQTVVAAVVTSGRGVGSVTVSLNGLEVMRGRPSGRRSPRSS
jgi:hypothetical protein